VPVSRSLVGTFTSKSTRQPNEVSICRRSLLGHYNSLKVRTFRRRLRLWRDSPKRPSGAKTVSAPGWSRIAWAILLAVGPGRPAHAQSLPSEPLVFGDGHITVGADVSATVSCAETAGTGSCGNDTGFFNYSDYEYSTLRMLRIDVNAVVRANRSLAVVADVQSENGDSPRPYALYVQLHPWAEHAFDINAGRVPPTFGAFPRRTYASDNVLIGYPLAYQYLTSLRPDAVPANVDELLRMRGRGWLSSFSLGNTTPERGVPLVTAFRWDTGVQVHSGWAWADAIGAVTTGPLSDPQFGDNNHGKQIAGRLAFHPEPGLLLGVSAARGQFLSGTAVPSAGIDVSDSSQTAVGADAEYSRAHYLVRFEGVRSTWTLPTIHQPIVATGGWIEGRYKIHPRAYAAARFDHLGFSTISGTTRTAEWDAPVTRVEVGGGYLLQRNLQLKVSFQKNTREGGRVTHLKIGSAQLVFWF
jgi:hypothetical protein